MAVAFRHQQQQQPLLWRCCIVLVLAVAATTAASTPITINNEALMERLDKTSSTNTHAYRSVTDQHGCSLRIPPALVTKCGTDTSPQLLGYATSTDASSVISFHDTIDEQVCSGAGGIVRIIHRQWSCNGIGDATTVQTIIVSDAAQAPVLAPIDAVLIPCNSTTSLIDSLGNVGEPEILSNCSSITMQVQDSTPALMCQPDTCQPVKAIVRTFRATDQCGNAAAPVTQLIQQQLCDAASATLCKNCQRPAGSSHEQRMIPMNGLGKGFNCFTGMPH
jgi:hypothetical protein